MRKHGSYNVYLYLDNVCNLCFLILSQQIWEDVLIEKLSEWHIGGIHYEFTYSDRKNNFEKKISTKDNPWRYVSSQINFQAYFFLTWDFFC